MRKNITFTRRRNADLMTAIRRILAADTSNTLTVRQVAAMAARQKAPQYYVSFDHAMHVLSLMRRKRDMSWTCPMSEMRWRSLDRAVRRAERMYGESLPCALQRVLTTHQAPCFFMAPATAQRVYFTMRKENRRQSRRKRGNSGCLVHIIKSGS